jgi:hypothetical protein
VCVAKDAHITSLQAEIEMLRRLALPTNNTLPIIEFEADAVMSGSQEQINLDEIDTKQHEEIAAEAARLLSGSYE